MTEEDSGAEVGVEERGVDAQQPCVRLVYWFDLLMLRRGCTRAPPGCYEDAGHTIVTRLY